MTRCIFSLLLAAFVCLILMGSGPCIGDSASYYCPGPDVRAPPQTMVACNVAPILIPKLSTKLSGIRGPLSQDCGECSACGIEICAPNRDIVQSNVWQALLAIGVNPSFLDCGNLGMNAAGLRTYAPALIRRWQGDGDLCVGDDEDCASGAGKGGPPAAPPWDGGNPWTYECDGTYTDTKTRTQTMVWGAAFQGPPAAAVYRLQAVFFSNFGTICVDGIKWSLIKVTNCHVISGMADDAGAPPLDVCGGIASGDACTTGADCASCLCELASGCLDDPTATACCL